jgi:DNA-binding IclR family transcriptional regulator
MSKSSSSLTRGITLLRLLHASQAYSLEKLVKLTGFPKSSLFRMMQELVDLGVVERLDNRKYVLKEIMLPVQEQAFEERLHVIMERLSSACAQTVEWYLPGQAGMVLTRRQLSIEAETGVRARIGFVREWVGELDAVLAVATAWELFEGEAPSLDSYMAYLAPFELDRLSAEAACERIRQARRERVLVDRIPNPNNVRRTAGILEHENRAVGVLAIAEVVHPAYPDRIDKLGELLRNELLV